MELFTANIKVNFNDMVRSKKAEMHFSPEKTTNNLSFCGMKNDARMFAFSAINRLLVILIRCRWSESEWELTMVSQNYLSSKIFLREK